MPKVYQYPSKVEPRLTTFEETITVDKWKPDYDWPEAYWRKNKLYSLAALYAKTVLNFIDSTPESEDKWVQPQSKPTFIPKQTRYITSGILELDSSQRPEAVTFDRWNFRQSLPRFDRSRSQFMYPIFQSNITPITPSTTVPIMRMLMGIGI